MLEQERFWRSRRSPENNYFGFFKDFKVVRIPLDPKKKITPLANPELVDYSINSWCSANCPFCSVSATKQGKHFDNVISKIKDLHENQPLNDRPFQIAFGGHGEPTAHPDFIEVLKLVNSLNIVPNYTTNGLHLSSELIETSRDYCGGVAVSCHPHLHKVWPKSAKTLANAGVKLCLHIIIGEPGSNSRFWEIYEEFKDLVLYFAALPYIPVGRAKNVDSIKDEFFSFFSELEKVDKTKVALGANFHSFMNENNISLGYSQFDPEIFSGHRMLDDSYKVLTKSSYDLSPKIL